MRILLSYREAVSRFTKGRGGQHKFSGIRSVVHIKIEISFALVIGDMARLHEPRVPVLSNAPAICYSDFVNPPFSPEQPHNDESF